MDAVDHSAKFKEAAKHGNLIPLYRPMFCDHLTPVLAYRCLVKEDDRDAPSFLFESVEPGLKVSNVVSLNFRHLALQFKGRAIGSMCLSVLKCVYITFLKGCFMFLWYFCSDFNGTGIQNFVLLNMKLIVLGEI